MWVGFFHVYEIGNDECSRKGLHSNNKISFPRVELLYFDTIDGFENPPFFLEILIYSWVLLCSTPFSLRSTLLEFFVWCMSFMAIR